jgi:predicted RNA-binding protein YlxR (DUF448 family)
MAEAAPDMASLDTVPDDPALPLRRCLVTGETRPKADLLRFVVDPDNRIVPDLDGRLPGRGLWVTTARATLERAIARNLFAKAARHAVEVDPALAGRVEELLVRRCIELIGLARRAGSAVAGHDRVAEFLARNAVGVILAASDSAEGGVAKLAAQAPSARRVSALSGTELGRAFGAEHRVHGVLGPGPLADKLTETAVRLARLRGFTLCPVPPDAPLS